MPRLMMFCGCEKLLVEPSSNSLSLISILEEVTVPVIGTDPLPFTMMAPIAWRAFALWQKGPGEDDLEFEQRVSLILPDRRVALEMLLSFRFGANSRMRTDNPVLGFPIGLPGESTLVLELRRVTEEDFKPAAEFGVRVVHVKATGDEMRAVTVTKLDSGDVEP